MTGNERETLARFLCEWPEDDTFEQVIFKVTNWDGTVEPGMDFDDIKRPELVARMYDYKASLDAATGRV